MNLFDKIYNQINNFDTDRSRVYARHIKAKLNQGLVQYSKSLDHASQKILNQGTDKVLKQMR